MRQRAKEEKRNRLALSFYMSVMKKFTPALYFFIIFLVLFVSGCGDESTSSSVANAPES